MTPDPACERRLTELLAPLQPETADLILTRLLTFIGDVELLARVMRQDGVPPDAVFAAVDACTDDFIEALTLDVLVLEAPFVVE